MWRFTTRTDLQRFRDYATRQKNMLQTSQRVTAAIDEYLEQTEPDQPELIRSDEPNGETPLGGPMSISLRFPMGYKKGKPTKGGGKKGK